jgi:metallophosphoesterase (TIGR00282 family)
VRVRVLLIGDIVGGPGRRAVQDLVPALRQQERVDVVIANAENVAAGSGITPPLADKIFKAGVDLITMGDHVYGKRDALPLLEKDARIVRPLNYPREAVGRGLAFHALPDSGPTVAVLQVQGRVFMGPSDCPFHAIDEALERARARAKLIFVDVHAEATSEKIAMGWFLDGRVSCIFGTHTHIQTADERILPKGSAYITDLGMTGPYESVIGRAITPVLKKFISNMPAPFDVAEGDPRLSGALVEVDSETGRATEIRRVHIPAPARAEAAS